MATQGPLYPGSTANLIEASTLENKDAWQNPGNIVSDNGTEATIVAASYDSPDISQILVASNFGFTTSGTIDGITVEIDRRSIVASSGKDFRVQLATGTTFASLVGTNKAVPATIWPTTSGIATYGGAADTWSAGLTAAQVNAAGFAVMLSCQANIANADVGVDFIRVTVTYTPPADTTVTPGVASLTLTTTGLAPTVAVTNNQLLTPSTAALATQGFAPTVTATAHQTVTPDRASLALSTFVPTVSVEAGGISVTPATVSLTTSTFAPTVTATNHQTVTPGVRALTTAAFAPTVTATNHQSVTPATASLTTTAFAPTVAATDHKTLVPSPASLTLTTYIPTIGNGVTVVPTAAALGLTSHVPTVALTDNQLMTPAVAALALTSFAPVVTVPQLVTPAAASLALALFAPTVSTGAPVLGPQPGFASVTVAAARGAVATTFTPNPSEGSVASGGSSGSTSSGGSEGSVS